MRIELCLVCLLSFPMLKVDATISQGEGIPLQTDSSTDSSALPKFDEAMTSFRTIYLSWSVPYFPLRTLLLYRRDQEDLNKIQLGSGLRNHTLESLESGATYEIILQVYYSSADLHTIRKTITTVPVLPHAHRGDMKIEVQFLLTDTGKSAKVISNSLTSQVKHLLVDYTDVENIYVYSIRKDMLSAYVTMYMNILQHETAQAVFYRLKDSLNILKADHLGFTYKIYQGCCEPLYFHHLNKQTDWDKKGILKLKIIPETAFSHGKCHKSLDMTKGDISVQTRGQHSLDAITISLYFKLNVVSGLHPVVSAVNYDTQLRLEVQEGKLVWMFYNMRNSQGFIVSTEYILKQDTWTHVLVDYDSNAGIGRIFVDGVFQKKTLSRVALSSNWMLGLRIGKYFSGGLDYKMDGYLDDLHIFDCIMTVKHINIIATSCGEFTCGAHEKSEGKNLKMKFIEKRKEESTIFVPHIVQLYGNALI